MAKSPVRSITLLSSPYHVGFCNYDVGAGPGFIRSRGLLSCLKELGVPVKEVEIEPVDDFEGEIGRSFELIRRTSALVSEAHNNRSFPIVLAGNCSATVGVAAGYNGSSKALQGPGELSCVWFDAHDDYNTPDEVLGGYWDSQGVALLAGECWRALVATVPGHKPMNLREKLVHVGMRDVNDLEREHVLKAGFDVVWGGGPAKPDFAGRLRRVLDAKGTGCPTMVHFDVDSLDPSLGQPNRFAAPGGLFEADLHGCFDAIARQTHPVSLTVASLDPEGEGAGNIADIVVRGVSKFMQTLLAEGILAGNGESDGH